MSSSGFKEYWLRIAVARCSAKLVTEVPGLSGNSVATNTYFPSLRRCTSMSQHESQFQNPLKLYIIVTKPRPYGQPTFRNRVEACPQPKPPGIVPLKE